MYVQAADWLGYTYLYVRMLRNPDQYGVPEGYEQNDSALLQHRTNLIHTAAGILDKTGLIRLVLYANMLIVLRI
jgi:pre-mRNA-splicing helicase BRR2